MEAMTPIGGRYHHGNLRAELLAHAEVKLAEGGVEGLSLRELARELGVSHGAPRQHFPDKQALLDALAAHGLERLGRALDAALTGARGTFAERLAVLASIYVGFATSHPALLALMFARKERPEATALHEAADRAFAAPSALIDQATAAGEIDGTDPDRVAMAVLATLQGLAALVTSGMIGDRPVDTVVSGTVETLVHGLLRPVTAGAPASDR
jgi:AcrR family transcriptional regulator